MLAENSPDIGHRELAIANHSCPFRRGHHNSVAKVHAGCHGLSARALSQAV